jgi:hypothetical protein
MNGIVSIDTTEDYAFIASETVRRDRNLTCSFYNNVYTG